MRSSPAGNPINPSEIADWHYEQLGERMFVYLECDRSVAYEVVEFPTNGGRAVKLYSVCSYSAGETYPSDECRRRVL
jgi:hypothetical protein